MKNPRQTGMLCLFNLAAKRRSVLVLCIKTPTQRIVALGREGIGNREGCNECLPGSVVADRVFPLGKVRSCVLVKLAGLI
jgi:hypothetical protein